MPRLVIETATSQALLALTSDSQVLAERVVEGLRRSSQTLLLELQLLLHEVGYTIDDLVGVISGVGPGSYTGVRTGVMVGQAIAKGRRIPWGGVCSLELFCPVSPLSRYVMAFDARAGGAYCLEMEVRGGEARPSGSAARLPWEEVLSFVADRGGALATPHLAAFTERLGAEGVSLVEARPSASVIIREADMPPPRAIWYGPSQWTRFLERMGAPSGEGGAGTCSTSGLREDGHSMSEAPLRLHGASPHPPVGDPCPPHPRAALQNEGHVPSRTGL